jgi:hypothetical protein
MLALVLIASVGRASAHVVTDNGCQGSGTFRATGTFVDAEAIGDQVVTIKRNDTVDWTGSVDAPPGDYNGSIAVDLPPPFGELKIDTWSGKSNNTETGGAKHYNLPSGVPAGVEFQVLGVHTDDNGYCNGYVNLQIDGGPFDSPATIVSLVATVLTGAGLFGTLRPLFRKRVAL